VLLRDQCHTRHELAWATVGTLRLTIEGTTWVLAGSRALWIPAGTRHDAVIDADGLALPVWFETSDCPLTWSRPTPIALASDLRALLHRYHQQLFSGLAVEPSEVAVLHDLIARQATALSPPPLPHHPQARTVAMALRDDPADRRTLADWAQEQFVASKTLQRAFVTETGRTFSRWRTEARLAAALPLLAEGREVTAVSRAVGYDTAGGFIAAYRRQFGHTPAAHRHRRLHRAS
jgi:AraC-like DNA-binding protein